MTKKIYVGNLPFSYTDAELEDLFKPHGAVASASLVLDRDTGRSRGFGFVEFDDSDEADNAISSLDGTEVEGRKLVVNEARAREPRRGGGGGGGGFRGGRGGRSGGGGGRGSYGR